MTTKLIQKISTPTKANTMEPSKTPGFIHSMTHPFVEFVAQPAHDHMDCRWPAVPQRPAATLAAYIPLPA
jgi:hypothetical protein